MAIFVVNVNAREAVFHPPTRDKPRIRPIDIIKHETKRE